MWPLRVYTRKKRAGQRLNLTPTPDAGPQALSEAPPGPRGRGAARGLPKIGERAERSRRGGGGPGRPSTQLRVTGETSLQGNSILQETRDEKTAPQSELVNDDLQVDSSSGLSLPCDVSSSLLSSSTTESYTEDKSVEDLSSFSSPELFRGSDYLDWEPFTLDDREQCRNSTLLNTSKAVAIGKAPPFPNLSAIVGISSENYQKSHTKTVMTLADQNNSPKPKCTSNSDSDNAACEVLLAEKTCPSTPKNTKRKKINSIIPGKKSRGLLTSTPSSEIADFVIDLSSVQKPSFEEIFPNVSNYVNSNEIVPVSSLQENPPNEFPSNTSEICCIIRASPGTRQMKNKGVTVNKKKYSPLEDITEDIIIKANDRR